MSDRCQLSAVVIMTRSSGAVEMTSIQFDKSTHVEAVGWVATGDRCSLPVSNRESWQFFKNNRTLNLTLWLLL